MNDLLQHSQPTAIEYPPNSNIYTAFINGNILLQYLKIPDIQREIVTERVIELKDKFESEYQTQGFYDFGLFLVCEYDDNLYLLNGQHRYNALKLINESKPDILLPVRVEVRQTNFKNEMIKIWSASNDTRQVKLVKNGTHQLIINGLRKHLNTKYSTYISSSLKPHKPHFNLDILVEEIERLDFITKSGISTPEELINEVEKINNFYKEVSYQTELWDKNGWGVVKADDFLSKCRKKSQVNTLYIGIYQNFEWLHRIIEHLDKNIEYTDMPHYLISAKSRKIKKKVIHQVWDKWNSFEKIKARNGEYSTCFVCWKQLEQENFQCGHIIPFFYGGDNVVDNLEPICSSCNSDMGIENLNTYKKRMFPHNML